MTGKHLLHRVPGLLGALILAVLITGCATPQVASLEADWPPELSTRVELQQVPFFPQEEHECGPAALATVAGAAGVSVSPERLVEQVYLPDRKGSLQLEILTATRRQGLLAYPLSPRVDAVLREVAAGNPVLVFQNLAFSFYPVWHYAVVVGYDRDRNTVLLRSGRTERLAMSLFTFERTWARAQHWAMLALPPNRLPATAQPQAYVSAAAALERLDPRAAQVAYASALAQWPDERVALLGAGNTAYTLGQLDAALAAYRKTVTLHVDFAEAWHNLAQVLLDLGRTTEAAAAIDKAVALGGVSLPRFQQLQDQIKGDPVLGVIGQAEPTTAPAPQR